MGIRIDRENLFKEKISTGINLFTGAGFSCLPDNEGNKLPVVSELCFEICEKFNLDYAEYGNDLEVISSLLKLRNSNEFQNYLRDRFTVERINSKYLLLNRISIKSYITTNIDNIVHLAIASGSRYYLNSVTYYGATRKNQSEICYIPLHGEVMNQDQPLYFGKFELATVDQSNFDLFQQAKQKLHGAATLFWGYGFHDSGVLKVINSLQEYGLQDIWVQFRENDNKQIKLFEALGCNVIVADTEELFNWIEDNTQEFKKEKETENLINNTQLKNYLIPTIDQTTAVGINDYIINGRTQWYSILTKQAFELDIVNDVYNKYISNKNTIIVGTSFSGKTTALMQLALKVDAQNKLFVSDLAPLTPEKSEFIIKNTNGKNVTIFVDNCEIDIKAYKMLAQAKNIKTIATATDYSFEASKHLLDEVEYELMLVNDLTQEQALRFYNFVDVSIREDVFKYKYIDNEKFSILEMMLNNIKHSLKYHTVKEVLLKVLEARPEVFDTVALTVYLSANKSALSTDILFSFFNCKSYEETQKYVNDASGLLKDLDVVFDKCDDDQDYYGVRSMLFLYHAKRVLVNDSKLKLAYGRVIEDFTMSISPYRIYRYDIFQRSAYDAKLFYSLFGQKANDIYDFLYKYDENPYTLQQWALCKSHLGDYKEAFALIDRAQLKMPNNFSIKNTSAIILFEANKNDETKMGIQKRIEAITILEDCYTNDKRKIYHANRFAEFAIHIANFDNNYDYINKAIDWLSGIEKRGENITRETQRHLQVLRNLR